MMILISSFFFGVRVHEVSVSVGVGRAVVVDFSILSLSSFFLSHWEEEERKKKKRSKG